MFARGLRKRDKSPFVKQNCPFSKESIKAAKDAVQSQIIQRARCEAEVQEAHTVGGEVLQVLRDVNKDIV